MGIRLFSTGLELVPLRTFQRETRRSGGELLLLELLLLLLLLVVVVTGAHSMDAIIHPLEDATQ